MNLLDLMRAGVLAAPPNASIGMGTLGGPYTPPTVAPPQQMPPSAPVAPPTRMQRFTAGLDKFLSGMDSPSAQIGMRMLMASGRRPGPAPGLGEIFAGAVSGYKSDAEQKAMALLQKEYLKAQTQKAGTENIPYGGMLRLPDGTIIRDDKAPTEYKPVEDPAEIRAYEISRDRLGYKGTIEDWKKLGQQYPPFQYQNIPTGPNQVQPSLIDPRAGKVKNIGAPVTTKPDANGMNDLKVAALKATQDSLARMQRTSDTLGSGGGFIEGRIPAMGEVAQDFEGAKAQLLANIQSALRVPGIGSQSNMELMALMDALPLRTQEKSVRDEQIKGIQSRLDAILKRESGDANSGRSFASEAEALASGVKGEVTIAGKRARID